MKRKGLYPYGIYTYGIQGYDGTYGHRTGGHWAAVITILVFLFTFSLRLIYINNPPFETGILWRQSDTESIARNFIDLRFNILYPQFNYDGPAPNYVQLEFQITTFIIAVLYKLFGFHYFLARLVPVLFFMGSAVFLYLIARDFFSRTAAWLAVLLYSLFPLNIVFSRAIMPESAALFFFTGAFYFFMRWIDNENRGLLLLSAIFTALAISQKIPAVFVGVPMCTAALVKYRRKAFKRWDLWLFAAISLLLPAAYFLWLGSVAEFNFVEGIATKHIFTKFYSEFLTPQAWKFFASNIPAAFTWVGVVLCICGFAALKWKKHYPIGVWCIAMILELLTIVAVIKFRYYMIFFGPVAALLGARLLALLCRRKIGILLAAGLLAITGWSSFQQVKDSYQLDDRVMIQASVVKQLAGKDDLIVAGWINPALINACERKGWRANINYYDFIPRGPEKEMEYFIERGAAWFVPIKGSIYNDADGSYKRYLEKNFEKLEPVEGYPIYRLK